MSMSQTIYEALCCSLVSMEDPEYRILLKDQDGVVLGRVDTLNPDDEYIPEVSFVLKANLAKQYVNLFVVEGRGTLNGDELQEEEYYRLRNNDILGFSSDSIHQFRVVVPEIL